MHQNGQITIVQKSLKSHLIAIHDLQIVETLPNPTGGRTPPAVTCRDHAPSHTKAEAKTKENCSLAVDWEILLEQLNSGQDWVIIQALTHIDPRNSVARKWTLYQVVRAETW